MEPRSKTNYAGNATDNFAKFEGNRGKHYATTTAFHCGTSHTSKFRDDISASGLGLKNTSNVNQCAMLLLVLKHLGASGINTAEGEACGYLRIATRIQELEERGWEILSLRENVIGADGLFHKGIARYVLAGRKVDLPVMQLEIDFSAHDEFSHLHANPQRHLPQTTGAFCSEAV